MSPVWTARTNLRQAGAVKQFPPLARASQYLVIDGKGILQKLGTVSGVKQPR